MNKKILYFISLASILILLHLEPRILARSGCSEEGFSRKHLIINSLGFFSEISKPVIEKIQTFPYVARQSALFAVKHGGGGSYHEELQAVVPNDPEAIMAYLAPLREKVANTIGVITPVNNRSTKSWQNTALTKEELLRDAKEAAIELKPLAEAACSTMDRVVVSFGKNDRNILKSSNSVSNKLEYMSLADLNDAVRGTIIAENIHDLLQSIGLFKAEVAKKGWKIAFYSAWSERRSSGYVGVHAKLYIPLSSNEGEKQRFVLGEMQFHLRPIHDGSFESPKEKSHILYDIQKENAAVASKDCDSASALIYAKAIEEVAASLDTRAALSKKGKEVIEEIPKSIAQSSLLHKESGLAHLRVL